jgi:hypothetical protein
VRVGYVAGAGPVGEGHGAAWLVEKVCGGGEREEVVLLFRERKLDGGVGSRMRVRERCRGISCLASTYGRCIECDTGVKYDHWLNDEFPMVNRTIKRFRDKMNISM